jgi:monovalent cation/hydrogen antiporter
MEGTAPGVNGFQQFQFVSLLLLIFLVGFGTLAHRLRIPYPIVLVIGGLLVSVVPGLPHISLNPDLVFVVMLPPLLFSAAYNTSWREFRRNFSTIFSLSFTLVAFTTVGIGLVAHWILPNMDWRLGLVLGAILSPTDAIAATAIGKRLHLPRRITDILEAESLVNDGSGLLALEFAVAIVVTGHAPTILEGLWRLLYLVVAGIVVGLVLGHVIYAFQKRIEDTPIEVTLSLITPYLAYSAGESIHASGILSVVACGLYLGRRTSLYLSTAARVEGFATWNTLTFVLNGIAFLLIGLQLPYIWQSSHHLGASNLLFSAAVVVSAVIGLRLAWVFARQFFARRFMSRIRRRPRPSASVRGLFIIGWTGMRGVVSLAAAISLPETTETGAPFPERSTIIYLTFCVIFVTLVLQGLTLPAIIRRLGLQRREGPEQEELAGRKRVIRAALRQLDELRDSDGGPAKERIYSELGQRYKARLRTLENREDSDGRDRSHDEDGVYDYNLYRSIGRQLRETERAAALKLRDENQIDDEVLRKIERELDLLDTRYPERS